MSGANHDLIQLLDEPGPQTASLKYIFGVSSGLAMPPILTGENPVRVMLATSPVSSLAVGAVTGRLMRREESR